MDELDQILNNWCAHLNLKGFNVEKSEVFVCLYLAVILTKFEWAPKNILVLQIFNDLYRENRDAYIAEILPLLRKGVTEVKLSEQAKTVQKRAKIWLAKRKKNG